MYSDRPPFQQELGDIKWNFWSGFCSFKNIELVKFNNDKAVINELFITETKELFQVLELKLGWYDFRDDSSRIWVCNCTITNSGWA